nr:Crp/Fnr family transcriptional regulator [Clostridium sp. DSM 8431]
MGLLLSGTILLTQEDIWGHRSIINKLPAGNTFAEPFATAKVPLNLSIEAHEDCLVILFKLDKLLSLDYLTDPTHNKLVKNLVNVLVKKAFNLNAKISHMNKRSTREKLLSYLSSQSQKNNNLEFDIPFDRQQLADYLGVERSAMSVELSKLQKDGILKTKRNHFKINMIEK